jgi:hypothetical protein
VGDIQGRAAMNLYQDIVWIDIKLEQQQKRELHLVYNEKLLSFHSIRPVEWGLITIERERNRLKLLVDQEAHYLIIFTKSSSAISPLSLQFFQSGAKIFEHQFSIKD